MSKSGSLIVLLSLALGSTTTIQAQILNQETVQPGPAESISRELLESGAIKPQGSIYFDPADTAPAPTPEEPLKYGWSVVVLELEDGTILEVVPVDEARRVVDAARRSCTGLYLPPPQADGLLNMQVAPLGRPHGLPGVSGHIQESTTINGGVQVQGGGRVRVGGVCIDGKCQGGVHKP